MQNVIKGKSWTTTKKRMSPSITYDTALEPTAGGVTNQFMMIASTLKIQNVCFTTALTVDFWVRPRWKRDINQGWNRRSERLLVKMSLIVLLPLLGENKTSYFVWINVGSAKSWSEQCEQFWWRLKCFMILHMVEGAASTAVQEVRMIYRVLMHTCACVRASRVSIGSWLLPFDLPVSTSFMASCWGERWSAIPTSPRSSLCSLSQAPPSPHTLSTNAPFC